jgi:formylglycine-generating enzyme required for sulfatase activity/serine/threonine protein kinase
MSANESGKSLSEGGTFAEQPKVDRDDVSLGDAATFAGSSKRRAAEMSLGDERTFGDRLDDQETVIDDIEIIDLAARYRTEGTLGRGGMGEVLLALDTRLGRKVAIKRILGEAARSRTAVSRFLTEAKAIAAISHPNVVQIYDYGRAKDGPFLIMEYVDGSSLLDRCRDGAIPLEEAVNLACQLCDGLAKAHDLGIVHRDIKPANVLLTKDGLPKLTDFGLAKAEAADHQMTITGAVLGTPDFMPPEQRRDAALVDARSDLWSLAATLYQMVTGRSPKIIRFNDVPAALQEVLAKALEEGKDDRYQSARELRDSLKASLVTAAPAPADLGEGQCPSCGVKNDSSRRFCRGCGESLEAPCLSCAKPMPMWEAICGQCGTKQPPLIEERRGEMVARQAEAESLLKDYAFERAEQIAVAIRDERDPRLKHLAPWSTTFLQKITTARDSQLAKAVASLSEALKHEASFDYPSAIHALEQVPEALRERALDGQAESVATALGRVSGKQSEVERLESLVKAKLAAKELGDLLPDAERLQALRPDRADVRKLCTQLTDRKQKLEAHRDDALRLAETHLASKEYESALAVLRKVDRSVETPEVWRLRNAADGNIKALQTLMREIGNAVSQKQLDGLISKVQAALALKPGHAELGKLLESLESRETKVAAGVQDVVSQADEAFKACRFDKAATILQRIHEGRRSGEVADLLDRCEYLAMTKAGVIKGFDSLPKVSDLSGVAGVDLSGLAIQGRSYLGQIATHGLSDSAIEQWCIKCEVAAAKREAAEEAERLAKANLRRLFIGAGLGVATLVLVAAGFAARSSWRSAAVQAALVRGDWLSVLSRDPDNVAALIGLAKSKLAAQPPDIGGAFTDLERAERINRTHPELKMARAAAHATRAMDHATNGRLSEAGADLKTAADIGLDDDRMQATRRALASAWQAQSVNEAQADRLDDASKSLNQVKLYTNEEHLLKTAVDAVGSAWVIRAEKAASANDIAALKNACDAAERAGTDKKRLASLWLVVASHSVKSLNGDSLSVACAAGERLGLPQREIANLWIQYGSKVAANGLQKGDIGRPATDIDSRNTELAAAAETAYKAATTARAAGASDNDVASLIARCKVLLAISAQSRGDTKAAAAGLFEAATREPTLVRETIDKPFNSSLRNALLAECHNRCDTAVTDKDWEKVIQIGAMAESLGSESSGWAGKAIASLPPKALASLSAATLATLPSATLFSLPPIRNSIGMELRVIPSGTFMRGQADTINGEPQHLVHLTKPFCIGVYEVTNSQWERVMGNVPSSRKDDARPVEQVSWDDAIAFCSKLSAMPEELRAGRIYRLPTDAEWEYACRAGTKTKYSFGDDEALLREFSWFRSNSGEQTHAVGQKKPNPWGLYDMYGNAWEWTADWFGSYAHGAVTDPVGKPALVNGVAVRVVRGGDFYTVAHNCQSAVRNPAEPSMRSSGLGFRLAASLSGSTSHEPPASRSPGHPEEDAESNKQR